MTGEPILDVFSIFVGRTPVSVMSYRPLGHNHDEFPHVQRQNIRGANRKRNRRQTKRLVKRYEQREAARDMRAELD